MPINKGVIMTRSLITSFLVVLSSIFSLASYAQVQVRLVPVDKVYVPSGFDSNDNTELVVTGYLPNKCYKSPQHEVKVLNNVVYVYITALYHDSFGAACAENSMIVPFMETVSLGVVAAGDYKIVVNPQMPQQLKSSITVKEAIASTIDDFEYAYVTSINEVPGSNQVEIKGYNPSDCFAFDEVRVFSNSKDTYSILPILKRVASFCAMKLTPFSKMVEIPNSLKAEKVLLHVRSMEGNSVNALHLTKPISNMNSTSTMQHSRF